MILHPILVALFLFVLHPQAIAAPSDAVAMIVSDKTGGRSGYGTGFLTTAEGEILTCYHVIQGATKIRVIVGDRWHNDVIVKAVSTRHDLATLQIANPRQRFPFIPTSRSATPGRFQNRTLNVHGYPATLLTSQHRFDAVASAGSFIKSSIPRSPDTLLSLFAIKDVDLIPLTMTIYNGLSGAPVLDNGVAVGVLSGSIEQGGSLAWAIPLKYMDSMTPIGKRPNQIVWQPLALMAPNWTHLLRESKVGLTLMIALDRYAAAVTRFQELARSMSTEWPRHTNSMLDGLKRAVDEIVRRRGVRYPLESAEADIDEAMTRVMAPIAARMAALERDFEPVSNAMADATGILTDELKAHFKTVPQTAANATLQTRVFSLWERHWDRLTAKAEALEDPSEQYETLYESLPDVDTIGEVQAALPQFIEGMRKISREQLATANETLEEMHAVAAIVDAAFAAGDSRR